MAPAGEKVATVTLDIEPDYGGQLGDRYHTLQHQGGLERLRRFTQQTQIPITGFIVGNSLDRHPEVVQTVQSFIAEFHLHSYSHDLNQGNSLSEIRLAKNAYERYFGRPPIGYRAPYGVISELETEYLHREGFLFDASIFPTYRPGLFNNLGYSSDPFFYQSGLCEIPFGVISGVRFPVTLSYIKFFGFTTFTVLAGMFGLPNLLVIDSHLHDYLVSDSLQELPWHKRFRYLRHQDSGVELLTQICQFLQHHGYRFETMGKIYTRLQSLASAPLVQGDPLDRPAAKS